jgi:hypothetical protein
MRKNRRGTGPVPVLVIGSLIACPGWLLRPGRKRHQSFAPDDVLDLPQPGGVFLHKGAGVQLTLLRSVPANGLPRPTIAP